MYIGLDNADDIETVLKSPHCLNKDTIYQYVRESLAVDGLFTSEGIFHLISKYFVRDIKKSYYLQHQYGNDIENMLVHHLVWDMCTEICQSSINI